MSWTSEYYGRYLVSPYEHPAFKSRMGFNENCFIRKDHKCEKLFGASKSCFIACPTDDDLEPILELMSEKLSKVGVEPIIAVKERAYGQDIFCTKICGKIIESRFCIVILDDTISKSSNIPNPNVYYEYGLMTSLGKHIIPLQKEGLNLAFNIQSYDTIKYSPKNIGQELDRAIKDAIKITEARDDDKPVAELPEKTLLRKLELSGFVVKDSQWFLWDVIEDTGFKGFGHDSRFYSYIGRIDSEEDFQSYIEDLNVVLYRSTKKRLELIGQVQDLNAQVYDLKKRIGHIAEGNRRKYSAEFDFELRTIDREINSTKASISEKKSRIELMTPVYIAFVVNPQLSADDFTPKAKELIDQYDSFELCTSKRGSLIVGDNTVDLASASRQ